MKEIFSALPADQGMNERMIRIQRSFDMLRKSGAEINEKQLTLLF